MPTRRSEGRRRRSNSTGEGSSRKVIEKTPDGFCTKVYPSGDRYEGSYFDGKRAGWGYYLWSSGDKFVGNWLAGVMHGSGTFTWATGDVYKGEWEMGKATGLGLKVTTDGTNIEGQFVDGLAQGWARKSFKFGDTYCGLCSSGLREGYGEYTWQSGDRFAGLWRNDVAVGPGVFSLCRRVPSGSSEVMEYSGDWANGKCHGWGRSTWSSLATEDVVAASAVLSGRGRRAGRFASSSARMVLFEAPPVGASTAGDQTDGDVTGELYEGDFVDGIRDGQGYQEKIHIISDPSNGVVQCYIETYSGQWRNEAWWGWGVLCTADGETYRGQFVSGARHGYGEQLNEAAPRSPENPKCGMWNNNSFSHSAPPP